MCIEIPAVVWRKAAELSVLEMVQAHQAADHTPRECATADVDARIRANLTPWESEDGFAEERRARLALAREARRG